MINQEELKELKNITERETADIIKHPEKKEELLDLKSAIIIMHELFHLITKEQAEELMEPIEQAGDRFYKEYLEEVGKIED